MNMSYCEARHSLHMLLESERDAPSVTFLHQGCSLSQTGATSRYYKSPYVLFSRVCRVDVSWAVKTHVTILRGGALSGLPSGFKAYLPCTVGTQAGCLGLL